MARVDFPPGLVAIIAGLPKRAEIPDDAANLRDLIAAVEARWPGVQHSLCASSQDIRKHISIFVDGRQATLDHAVRPDSVVRVLTAVSGG